jgi:hypothetical protein
MQLKEPLYESPPVIPAKAGIQAVFLDSGFRRNDEEGHRGLSWFVVTKGVMTAGETRWLKTRD